MMMIWDSYCGGAMVPREALLLMLWFFILSILYSNSVYIFLDAFIFKYDWPQTFKFRNLISFKYMNDKKRSGNYKFPIHLSEIKNTNNDYQFTFSDNEETWINSVKLGLNILRRDVDCVQKSLLTKPPILFVHGSFHSGWCFQENFFDYFSSLGHDCYAISFRGTGPTGLPPDSVKKNNVKVEEHVEDLAFVVNRICRESIKRNISKPIIISHSFGGLVLMKLLEQAAMRDSISGSVFLCSIPPSGNAAMTKRFLRKNFLLSLRIVWGFVFKGSSNQLIKQLSYFITWFRCDDKSLTLSRTFLLEFQRR